MEQRSREMMIESRKVDAAFGANKLPAPAFPTLRTCYTISSASVSWSRELKATFWKSLRAYTDETDATRYKHRRIQDVTWGSVTIAVSEGSCCVYSRVRWLLYASWSQSCTGDVDKGRLYDVPKLRAAWWSEMRSASKENPKKS